MKSVKALLVLFAVLAPVSGVAFASEPLVVDDAGDELAIELERSSHVIRAEEDRVLVRFRLGGWRVLALGGNRAPPFSADEDRFGLGVEKRFGRHEVMLVARTTQAALGDDRRVGSLSWELHGRDGSGFGAEVTYAEGGLADDGFLVGNDERQTVARLRYRRSAKLEFELFGAENGDFDLQRGTREILERLPRSELAGVETLADLDVDEGRIEDSVGLRARFGGARVRGSAYVKSGQQQIRGVGEGDDFVGIGGSLELEGERLALRTQLDVRDLDSADGVTGFHRGRFLVDARFDSDRFELGGGGYVQGESEDLGKVFDLYDTAGVAFRGGLRWGGGRMLGFWGMLEDNAPDFQKIGRVALFYRPAGEAWEIGAGARRDELGRRNFQREETGPFVFLRGRLPGTALDVDTSVGVLDGETYGRLLIRFKR